MKIIFLENIQSCHVGHNSLAKGDTIYEIKGDTGIGDYDKRALLHLPNMLRGLPLQSLPCIPHLHMCFLMAYASYNCHQINFLFLVSLLLFSSSFTKTYRQLLSAYEGAP